MDEEDILQYVAGPLALAVAAAAWNTAMRRRGRPTISAGIRWLVAHGYGAEMVGAAVGGLLAHWFLKHPENT